MSSSSFGEEKKQQGKAQSLESEYPDLRVQMMDKYFPSIAEANHDMMARARAARLTWTLFTATKST